MLLNEVLEEVVRVRGLRCLCLASAKGLAASMRRNVVGRRLQCDLNRDCADGEFSSI